MATIEDYRAELDSRKAEIAALMRHIYAGQALLNELASASDGAVLAGEPFPDDLNKRVRQWCQENLAAPLLHTRYVSQQPMKWGGVPVLVDGLVATAPDNWALIDCHVGLGGGAKAAAPTP